MDDSVALPRLGVVGACGPARRPRVRDCWRCGPSGCGSVALALPNGVEGVVIESAYAGDALAVTVRLADGSVLRVRRSLADGLDARPDRNRATRCGSAGSPRPACCCRNDHDRRRHRRPSRRWVLLLPVAWLLLLLAAPLAIVVLIAFARAGRWRAAVQPGMVTLDNLWLVATDPLYRDALLRSVRVAGLSTLICLLAGFPMALAIARAAPRWQNPLLLAVMLPFWTGFLMRINAWIGLLADDG